MTCIGCTTEEVSTAPSLCERCSTLDYFVGDMIADLLRAEVIFPAAQDRPLMTDGRVDLPVTLYVLASDTFAYACADAEELTFDQVSALYRLWCKDRVWGPVVWLVNARKARPLPQVEQRLREAGLWTELMETL